jgi:hypothetical protein
MSVAWFHAAVIAYATDFDHERDDCDALHVQESPSGAGHRPGRPEAWSCARCRVQGQIACSEGALRDLAERGEHHR